MIFMDFSVSPGLLRSLLMGVMLLGLRRLLRLFLWEREVSLVIQLFVQFEVLVKEDHFYYASENILAPLEEQLKVLGDLL